LLDSAPEDNEVSSVATLLEGRDARRGAVTAAKTPRIHIDEVAGRVLPGPGVRDSPAATNSTSASTASTPSGGAAMFGAATMHSIEEGYDTSLKTAVELCGQMRCLVSPFGHQAMPAPARSCARIVYRLVE
jgi:hypothetical protein